ncbi:4-hydroxybenzoate polyprenyltransferase [hydrothermal vent metagenome]|uniref:4-hydroxybenzoate polyprenyltransferase n=1 Tax=hydrothermal vent metagenome TaxID=652676 RepID=A0A3B0WK46_9ZZZZ
MDIAKKISKLISYLLPKIKNSGRQSYILSKKIFEATISLSIITYKTVWQTLIFLHKASNQTINYLAHHPLLDKAVVFYRYLNKKIIQLSNQFFRSIKKTRAYKKAGLYAQLIRLDKPIGIFLLLWPTLIALWIAAEGWPDPLVLFIFISGVILMRSAGCAINDYADRDIDKKVTRTKQRPLAAGKISKTEALVVFISLSLVAFALVLLMNELTIWMSLGGILLAVSYPFMKRYHYLPQVHLGAAFGWAAPMAYTAQANEITSITWLIFLATILWATAYDTMYAMVDYDDDIKIGVKSTAILFGNQDKIIIAAIQLLLIFNLLLIGHRAELSGFYYIGVAAASLFAAYQQFLIKDREPALCFQAFLNNNWFGLVLFIGVFLDYQFADMV